MADSSEPETLTTVGHSFLQSDDVPEVVKPLVDIIQEGKSEEVVRIISEIKSKNSLKDLHVLFDEEETILHRAVKMRAPRDIISALLIECPDLLTEARKNSEIYRGQTALHIAITGEDIEVTETLLQRAKELGVIESVLSNGATGSRFENTVMLGEIPLLVAALTLNLKLFDKLLEHGAKIDSQNSRGDNVCHCLIRYAHLYPEKIADIMALMKHVSGMKLESEGETSGKSATPPNRKMYSNKSSDCRKYLWLMSNNEDLNPLKLAAKLGQQPIFKFIMEMKGVYCYVNSEDGLFDVELYDVTDIDATSEFKLVNLIPWIDSQGSEKTSFPEEKQKKTGVPVCKVPTLEMIFDSDSSTVFKFIEMSPLRYVINRKWEVYRWVFTLWGVLHILFMIGFTVYAVRRSCVPYNGTDATRNVHTIGQDRYVTFYSVLSLVFACVYLLQEIIRIIKGHMPWSLSHVMNCYHNGPFRLVLTLYAVTVLVDFIWRITDEEYGDYILVCSMIMGWWFLVFFLRGFRQFSFFTVMIQKVLVGDMFRFSIIIGMELIAFTSGIFIVFRGSPKLTGDIPENENVHDYPVLMIAMFKMMFGFTSLDILFDAPSPWFAVCIYVAFVLLTYVLMINSLIAMMSNTCSFVSQNRDIQYRVQQLSIILFFESILPARFMQIVGQPRVCDWYDINSKKIVKRTRSFMEVRSLHEVTKSRSRHRPNTDTMLETIFHAVKNIKLPTIDVFEDQPRDDYTNIHKPVEVRRSSLENIPAGSSNRNTMTDKNVENQNLPLKRKHKKKKRERHSNEVEEYRPGDEISVIDHNKVEGDTEIVDRNEDRSNFHSISHNDHRLTSVEQI